MVDHFGINIVTNAFLFLFEVIAVQEILKVQLFQR